MRISDWSSDVCSSDLTDDGNPFAHQLLRHLADAGAAAGRVEVDEWRFRIVVRHHAPGAGGHLRVERRRLVGKKRHKIGRASCRERVCQYVSISVVAVSLKKKNKYTNS